MVNTYNSFLCKKGKVFLALVAVGLFSSSAFAITNTGRELGAIKRLAERDRTKLIDLAKELSEEIEKLEDESEESPENIQTLRAERDILRALEGENNLEQIAAAVDRADKEADLANFPAQKSKRIVQKTGSAFNVEVTYSAEESVNGETPKVTKEVKLVEAKPEDVSDPVVKDIIDDEMPLVVQQSALKNATEKLNEQIKDVDFVSEKKITQDQEEKIQDKLSDAEKDVDADLNVAQEKREIASEDKGDEIERKKAAKAFADYAKDYPDAVKNMSDCQMAEKAMDLNPALVFDMLDEDTREDCEELKKKSLARAERGLLEDNLDLGSSELTSAQNSDANSKLQQANMIADQAKFQMQVMQACFQTNVAARDSIKRFEQTIKPAYESISGFDQLEKMLASAASAQNVLATMSSEGTDGESAAISMMTEFNSLYPADTEVGNTQLHSEVRKLFNLKGKLGYFIDEYNKRTEQIAIAVADQKASEFLSISQRAQGGDQAAQQQIALMQQQGQPVDPASVYQMHYQSQKTQRQNDPNHQQQLRYQEAVSATSSVLSQMYESRRRQIQSGGSNWVSGGSSPIVNQARSVINSSSMVNRTPNTSAAQAGGGAYRSQGGTAGPARAPAATRRSDGRTNINR